MKQLQATVLAAAIGLGTTGAIAANPYAKADESWISISGTIVEAKDNNFLLDYGEGVITVELDDWDIYKEAYPLMDGDRVTVYGRIDDDLFETAKIEAGAVHVKGLNTYLYASSADEEDTDSEFYSYSWTNGVPINNEVNIRGTVTSVSPGDREFKVNRGNREIKVETNSMGFNPLDQYGYQRIEKGDVVNVKGNLDTGFFGSRVLDAESITELQDASKGKS